MPLSIGHLYNSLGMKKVPSYKANHTCQKLLYVIQSQVKSLYSNFLASADIKVFGHTYLFAMLLLIGSSHFYAQHITTFCKQMSGMYADATL